MLADRFMRSKLPRLESLGYVGAIAMRSVRRAGFEHRARCVDAGPGADDAHDRRVEAVGELREVRLGAGGFAKVAHRKQHLRREGVFYVLDRSLLATKVVDPT